MYSLLLTLAENVFGTSFSLVHNAASLGAGRGKGTPNQPSLDISPAHQWVPDGHHLYSSHVTDEELCIEKGRWLAKVPTVGPGGSHLDTWLMSFPFHSLHLFASIACYAKHCGWCKSGTCPLFHLLWCAGEDEIEQAQQCDMVGEAQGALEHILRMTYIVWVSVIQEGFLEEMTFKLM